MSKSFDPQMVTRQLQSDTGIERSLKSDFNKKKAECGLWGATNGFLKNVINAHLVGMNDHLDEILAKARMWIEVATNEKEVCGGYSLAFLESEHRITWSVCNWLLGHADNPELTGAAAEFASLSLKDEPDTVSDSWALGLASLVFVEGRHYAEFLHWAKANGKIPLGLPQAKIRGEASVCAAICLARTENHYSQEDITKILHRLLSMKMNEWLTSGNELRAARWLKLAYWQDGHSGLTPKEVILKAYHHLPKAPV